MKCFLLSCHLEIAFYDELLVPLLQRMSNLEKFFLIIRDRDSPSNSFIDGNALQNDIIRHMPNLNQFVFSIQSLIHIVDSNHLPSNDDIQHTFKALEDYQIVSYIDYFPSDEISECHVYSLNSFHRLTNNFPGGYFPFVQKVSLFDHHPFEHQFCNRIAQAFPFLRILIITNQSNENRSNLSIIDYTHLTMLDVEISHHHYMEQFLDGKKTFFRNSIRLIADYHDLERLTNNFTKDKTRINCAKIKHFDYFERWNVPSHFHDYFPLLKKLRHWFILQLCSNKIL